MDQNTNHSVPAGPLSISSMKTAQKAGMSLWEVLSSSNVFYGSSDASLFSSSLPVFGHEKLHDVHSTGNSSSKLRTLGKDAEGKFSTDDLALQGNGALLPDDDEDLLAGIIDDFDLRCLPRQVEESEDYDLFGSGGGFELDSAPTESITIGMAKASISDGHADNGISRHNFPNGVGTIIGEHPYGEHPSRTLFVRNINSNVEDSELRSLFEPYGDIRSLYTACKHRGFVMISYYDIRSAKTAMRALQNKPLKRRKLDIHFSIPKENPSDKDMNQGTLVIFNLDPSVSNNDLLQIFGAYGEVKEIRETPNKRHHKFIEFYDVRSAEAALRSLNKCDIAGKRIKLEPSRPGGARRNLMQQVTHDMEPDETRLYQLQGSSVNNFSGTWLHFNSPIDNSPLQASTKYSAGGILNPLGSNHLPGSSTMLPSLISNSTKVAPIGKDQKGDNYADRFFSGSNSPHEGGFHHSRSFLDHSGKMASDPGTLSSLCPSTSNASGLGTLTGPQFLWGSSTSYMDHSHSSSWKSRAMGLPFPSKDRQQVQSVSYSSYHGSFLGSSHSQHHQVGSAPPGVSFKRQYGYFPETLETSFMNQAASGNMLTSKNTGSNPTNMWNTGIAVSGNVADNSSPKPKMISSETFSPTFFGNYQNPGLGLSGFQGLFDQGHGQLFDNRGSQEDNKKQYWLHLGKIVRGEDTRTTLMIKNIPNKYTLKMLLATIDENHKGTYDFLYLPIDFKNKCNVGYAFINMMSPSHIISFYETFSGKKWENFNSEKVASLAYARIQGKAALCAHFENSCLMNEDKRCRRTILDSEVLEGVDQKLFLLDGMDMHVCQKDGTSSVGLSQACKFNEKSEKTTLPGSALEG